MIKKRLKWAGSSPSLSGTAGSISISGHYANYGTNQRIVQWDQQLGSFPATRFEYMKVKD